ncbi:MAG: NAD(P)/FAD-dependent oxidoreductase [Planctomycetota bacterium]|jgi:sulfide:quinone oxidoreductase
MTSTKDHYQVLIVGAGSGGLSVAARLGKARKDLEIAVIDPSDKHYYQPLWTMVGGGVRKKEVTERPQASVIPKGTQWIQDAVTEFHPEGNRVTTASGKQIGYDYLVVAPGLQLDWGKIPGLADHVGKGNICSNYSYDTVDSTWRNIQEFEGGTAVFTHPNTPIKCGGAPQKIMYLAADYWRRNPPKNDYKVVFCIATPGIFAVKKYADSLLKAVARYGIEVRYQHDLTSLDQAKDRATFRRLDSGEDVDLDYSMMHVTPPMSAPDFIKGSPLANADGWVAVDKTTLQHVDHDNVFALGDASSLPTSKTGAAIRKQAPALVTNLIDAMEGRALSGKYDGYTSCPLVTGYGKLVMAEFDYDLNLQETFPIDQSKERLSMYLVKKHLLPILYWDGMLKGRA